MEKHALPSPSIAHRYQWCLLGAASHSETRKGDRVGTRVPMNRQGWSQCVLDDLHATFPLPGKSAVLGEHQPAFNVILLTDMCQTSSSHT